MENKNALYVSGSIILVLIISIIITGNRVSDDIEAQKFSGQENWIMSEFGDLQPNDIDYLVWPDLFNNTAKNLGFKNYDDWKEDNFETTSSLFKIGLDNELVEQSKYQAGNSSAVAMYNKWMLDRTMSEDQFRADYGLTNPLSFFAWVIYVKIYSI